MDSEKCVPAPLQQQQQQPHHHNSGRNRKRGGIDVTMSSSIETVAPLQHHDKVLRSHTRRGRGGPSMASPVPTISNTLTSSRRRQRSSCCSSHTDEDEGASGGGAEYGGTCVVVNAEERGKLEEGASSNNNNNNNNNGKNKGVERSSGGGEHTSSSAAAALIPSSSSCFAPTNETKELREQAGLLGGTTKTTTIHSGGTRLSSSCIPQHNELTTQQCHSNNAGEHSTSDNNATSNSSQKMQAIMDNNVPRFRRRSRQHGNNHQPQRSTPPAASADGDDDNVAQRRESGDDNDDDEMCGEDAASCELPGKPNTAAQGSSSASSSTSAVHHSLSSLAIGQLSAVVTVTAAVSVKSERGICGNENFGGKDQEKSSNNRRASTTQQQYPIKQAIVICESVPEVREIESEVKSGDTCDLTGVAAGSRKVNKIDGDQDGRWSVGEDSRQDGEKGERQFHSSSVFSIGDVGGASMPLDAGLKVSGIHDDGGKYTAPVGGEQVTGNTNNNNKNAAKVGARSVKKCASGGGATNKKQSATHNFNNNNNNSGSGKNNFGTAAGKKALVPAPMLLMNNLPYMGELTFDTRPRRGRKPKKADICHLITKNYGIQFPAGVTQASVIASAATFVPIISSKPSQPKHTSPSKKTTSETITSTKNVSSASSSTRSLVPPTFCNRDVSIVPIISTTWGSGGGGTPLSLPITTDTKCSTSSTANLLKPLSSLAQQLMLHHQNPLPHGSSSSSRSITSATTQQTISMFPLPTTPSSFTHAHHSASLRKSERSKGYGGGGSEEYNNGGEEDDNSMEVDIQVPGREEGDNQDSPLNLCMRDKTMVLSSHHYHHRQTSNNNQEPLSLVKDESLDVRWSRGVGGSSKAAMVRSSNSFSSDGAMKDGSSGGGGSNKRGMISSGSANSSTKGGKSAKLSASTTSTTSNFSVYVNSSSSGNSDSVSNLVSRRPIPSPSSTPFGSNQAPSKLSPNIFAISAHHLQTQGLENAGKSGTGGKGKQSGQSRKKKEVNLRGDISISATGSPGSQSGSGGTSVTTPLSSFGGTLFGQSTAGINEGAEVSICKFKFTGGAKPCLQEKKMLSVDSGGNFRFYSDKTSGPAASGGGSGGAGSTGKLSCKGQQLQQFPSTSNAAGGRTDLCQSPSATADGVECHYALSSLPKSAKSMSMCMPQGTVNNSGIQVQSSSMSSTSVSTKSGPVSSKLSLPLIPSPSTSSGVNPYAALPISPTTEELQQLHLSMQDQVPRGSSSSRLSPYASGDYSFSSSNSCSSSDNCFGGDAPSSSSAKSGKQTSSNNHYASGSGKMKLKRKRRTRKSLMREKLEKTFKEKGFLIQTQQLESAEGATYCKFRQLRKFTRYLFRSWKDYLPDHVKEISDTNANGAIPGAEQQQIPNNDETRHSTGQKGDDSNVQSMADDDEGDLEDEEEDGDEEEDDEVDSEEQQQRQQRQGLISHENTTMANDGEDNDNDESDEEAGEETFKGSSRRRRHRQRGNKRASTSTTTGKKVAVAETKVKVENDLETSKDEKDIEDEEEVELQVDV